MLSRSAKLCTVLASVVVTGKSRSICLAEAYVVDWMTS